MAFRLFPPPLTGRVRVAVGYKIPSPLRGRVRVGVEFRIREDWLTDTIS